MCTSSHKKYFQPHIDDNIAYRMGANRNKVCNEINKIHLEVYKLDFYLCL